MAQDAGDVCTDILYYIPEDNEKRPGSQINQQSAYDQSANVTYNVFTIPGKSLDQVNLTDVEKWFPLPGSYHFRFQFVYNKNIICWLDINNKTCKLPQVDGMIVMKVLR